MKRRLITWIAIFLCIASFASFIYKLVLIERAKTSHKQTIKKATPHTKTSSNNTTKKTQPVKTVSKKEVPKPKSETLKSPHPFVITNNRNTYIVLKRKRKVLHIVDGKQSALSRRTQRIIYSRVARSGLNNCACQKSKGRRFLCVFSNGKTREVTLRLLCELLVVAQNGEETTYPKELLDFPYKWQKALMNLKKDFNAYAHLYHPDFHSRFGNLKAWLNYHRQNLDAIKYIDVVVDDPAIVKIPSSKLFAIFFHEIYRTNIKRIDTTKALIVTPTPQGLKIISESYL